MPRTATLSAESRLLYADSSALVKLVLSESETAALREHLSAPTMLATSGIGLAEVPRAVARGNPSAEARAKAGRLLEDCILIDVTDELLRVAAELPPAPLRTLDAIHLASALSIQADVLLAYDRRLLAAATESGLPVMSPGAR